MAEIDDVRAAIERAADSGDEAQVLQLSARYRDLQAAAGQLPNVGRLRPESGREFQLSRRAMQLRAAGREEDARQVIRVIARERFARNITRGGRGRGEAALFGANRGVLNLGTLASGGRELIEDTFGGNRNNITAREHMEDFSAAQDIVRERHPVSAGAGEIGGIVVTLPAAGGAGRIVEQGAGRVLPQVTARLRAVAPASAIGAEARAAQIAARGGRAGQIGRGTTRGMIAGGTFGGVQGASDAYVRDQDVGEGAAEGAALGAVLGPVVEGGARVVGGLAEPILQRLSSDPLVRRIAARLQEPVADVVQRMNRFYAANGRMPSAIEILSPRSGREVSETISGHGEAVERAINRSDEVVRARPGQMAEAIENGQPRARETSQEIVDETSEQFTQAMRPIENTRINIADADLALLNTRTAQAAMKLEDGVLSDAGERIRAAVSQRQAAAATANAVREAQQRAAAAVRAAQASPTPTNQRRIQQAMTDLRNARARARAAASEVKPVHLTIREIETLRHDIGKKANNGNTYALNELADQIRELARRNGGREGQQYETTLRYFASQRARAEGVTAGRSMARNATDDNIAAASGSGSAPSLRLDTAGGGREGVISGLAEQSAAGPGPMRRTAERLSEDANLARGLDETVGPAEGARLREVGEVNREAAENLERATPRREVALSEEMQKAQQALLGAGVILQGSTGGAFRAKFVERLSSTLSVSSAQATELAEMAFNPQRVGEFINLLGRFSGSAERFRQTMQRLIGVLPATVQRRWNDSTAVGERTDEESEQTIEGRPYTGAPAEAESAEPLVFSEVSPDYLSRLAEIESSGDPMARARTSSAAGLYQFTEGTWLDTVRRHAANVGLERLAAAADDPSKRAQLLQLRFDPEIAGRFAAALTADNFNALEQELGREPSPGELYAAHFLGLGGARRLIQAIEGDVQNAAEEFPREARANRAIFYDNGRPRTAQEVLDELESKWN